ncbi:hypothetical protein GQ44DRAFT_706705 [Phaeosphaeriaceae sp. PMI808]|nr:hypothetical protein GQ44DRAFT_706705 [Phaeosphaeriaceae sp. PMI808]
MNHGITAPSPGAVLACGITFPIVCAIAVGVRFQSRRTSKSQLVVDDWLTVPALICVLAMGVSLVVGVAHEGLGYPTPQPPASNENLTFIAPQTVLTRKVEYAIELLQFPALTCTKLSLLFFYKRIFCTPWRRLLRSVFLVLILICILWGIGFLSSMAFICGRHVPAFWGTVQDLKTHCPGLHDQEIWLVCTDFFIDVLIFLVPIPLVVQLEMAFARKIAVMVIFLFAAITVGASLTRMIIFLRAISSLRKKYNSSGHDNLIITAGLYWTMFETGMGLIVVCLPSHYVLAQTIWKPWFSADMPDDINGYRNSDRESEQTRVEVSESQRSLEVAAHRTLYLGRTETQSTASSTYS